MNPLQPHRLALCRRRMIEWWQGRELVVWITAPRSDRPATPPPQPTDPNKAWLDVPHRVSSAVARVANTVWAGEAVPYLPLNMGPGSLGTFLGAQPVFEPHTVWYKPCITDGSLDQPISLDPRNNRWLDQHLELTDALLAASEQQFFVGMPDLIENIDVLAAMRDSQTLLLDLIERPQWVEQRLWEINEAFFRAFDIFYERLSRQQGGGNWFFFEIWGPGKTAKVQCDFSCMISPSMFRRFVVPALTAQCGWLDYSMYHLDGEGALGHLDALLEIEPLKAIEWTPTGAWGDDPQNPRGASPAWHDMYRRIKSAGKSVQAVGLRASEVVGLIEAVGPQGLFIQCFVRDEDEASTLAQKLEQYHSVR